MSPCSDTSKLTSEASDDERGFSPVAIFEEDTTVLDLKSCPILRDSQNCYKPLEKHYGTLTSGQSFGESGFLHNQDRPRFFNAIAMTDCLILQLQKSDFDKQIAKQEKNIFNEKMAFLTSCPALSKLHLTRSKLLYLTESLLPIQCIKSTQLYKEGDFCKYLYIVRSGEFQITKKVLLPKLDEEIDEF